MELSVLDLSPVTGEATQAQAVRETLEVAKAAERLGYHRFWVAEHHNIAALGSPNPEILIAALTQATSRIRLGSGGVMLVNYSPLKVAETFMELEALAPGRIDLGLGRALGADARTGGALRSVGSDAFPQYFQLLTTWLLDASGKAPIPDGHPIFDIKANPSGPSHPDLFVLCTSEESAAFEHNMVPDLPLDRRASGVRGNASPGGSLTKLGAPGVLWYAENVVVGHGHEANGVPGPKARARGPPQCAPGWPPRRSPRRRLLAPRRRVPRRRQAPGADVLGALRGDRAIRCRRIHVLSRR